jgi:hypothetical protein
MDGAMNGGPDESAWMRQPSARIVGFVVGATIALTAFHFTDNIVNVDTYPRQEWLSATAIQVGALVFWPIMAGLGVAAYLHYRRGRFPLANWLLVAFSYIGLVSIGHFTTASPDELTTRGLISVVIDGVMGFIVLGMALWSMLARRRATVPSAAPS